MEGENTFLYVCLLHSICGIAIIWECFSYVSTVYVVAVHMRMVVRKKIVHTVIIPCCSYFDKTKCWRKDAAREYWMIYRGPAFSHWYDGMIGSYTHVLRQQGVSLSQSSCVSPVVLWRGLSYDCEKSWSSIKHSTLWTQLIPFFLLIFCPIRCLSYTVLTQ